jgi:hypothetical protein
MSYEKSRCQFLISCSLPALFGCILVIALSSPALGVPYASGISESVGTVTYVLNEDADSITIKRTGDTDLILAGGDLLKGTHTFAKGSATGYQIEVSKNTAESWTQINDPNTEVTSQYYSPRGVAVNKNPASPYFGNIYVSNALQGSTGDPNGVGRTTMSNGLYAITADGTDVYGIGDIARDGGLFFEFSDSNGNTPFRLTIAPDDSIYIGGYSDGAPGVWRAPSDLSGVSWPAVLANSNCTTSGLCDNHGNVPTMWVEGTGASTVLYTLDEDYTLPGDGNGRGDVFRYDIGTATDYAGLPTIQVNDAPLPDGKILNSRMDVVRDEDGSWWLAQYRFDDTEGVPALSHWADDPNGGEALWVSGRPIKEDADFDHDLFVSGLDFLIWQKNFGNPGSNPAGDANFDGNVDPNDLPIWEAQYGTESDCCSLDLGRGTLDIDNERERIILGASVNSGNSNGIYVLDISDPNHPFLEAVIPAVGETNDVAFDIAGNVYVVNRISETLAIWSSGGNFVATTGSDGSFSLAPGALAAAAAVPEPSTLFCWFAFSLLGPWRYRARPPQ